jgi:hypothetical protein
MNSLAIQLVAIFLLVSVFVFGKYLRTPLSGAPRRWLSAAAVLVSGQNPENQFEKKAEDSNHPHSGPTPRRRRKQFCHSQKISLSASCISLGSRALEIAAKFDAPKIRPGRVKFG